jgi:hypothetical protein
MRVSTWRDAGSRKGGASAESPRWRCDRSLAGVGDATRMSYGSHNRGCVVCQTQPHIAHT